MICYLKQYKINEILNKFLLTGDKFMSEINLRQPVVPLCLVNLINLCLHRVLVDYSLKTKKK